MKGKNVRPFFQREKPHSQPHTDTHHRQKAKIKLNFAKFKLNLRKFKLCLYKFKLCFEFSLRLKKVCISKRLFSGGCGLEGPKGVIWCLVVRLTWDSFRFHRLLLRFYVGSVTLTAWM